MMTVSNTSPLILLDKVGHLFLLEQLFQKVIIPPAVDKEWLRPGASFRHGYPLSPLPPKHRKLPMTCATE
jgi:hypothetical protein